VSRRASARERVEAFSLNTMIRNIEALYSGETFESSEAEFEETSPEEAEA
jgi:hypothetical protein